jgi:hypothetical protein
MNVGISITMRELSTITQCGWLRKKSFDATMQALETDNIIHNATIYYVACDDSIDLEIRYRSVQTGNGYTIWVTNDERRRIMRHISKIYGMRHIQKVDRQDALLAKVAGLESKNGVRTATEDVI